MIKNKNILRIIKYSVILLIFFFIIRYLYLNISSIDINLIKFNYTYLFFSVIVYICHIIFNTIIWYIITVQNNCEINFFETIKLRIYADLGKYIPGKVFTYGILLYSYEQKSISKKKIAVCTLQEFILSILAAIIIALISIFLSDIEKLNHYKIVFFISACICLIFLHPKILLFLANFILKILKRENISIDLPFYKILSIMLLFFISWIIFGWAFYFFVNSFYPYPLSEYFFTTGAFAIAGLIGFMAVFAPAGLGVREGVLVFILSFVFPSAIAVIISLISRIWITFCELLIFIIVFLLSSFMKKKRKEIVRKAP